MQIFHALGTIECGLRGGVANSFKQGPGKELKCVRLITPQAGWLG